MPLACLIGIYIRIMPWTKTHNPFRKVGRLRKRFLGRGSVRVFQLAGRVLKPRAKGSGCAYGRIMDKKPER
jgi:hypothetical protein